MSERKHFCLIKEDHSGHLCMPAGKDKSAEIKKLTRNPKFICFNSGRVADSNRNLRNPMTLD